MYRTSKILEGKIFILIRYFTKDPRVNRPKALIGRRAKEIKYDLLCVRERQTCLHRIKWLPLLTSVIAAIYFISFAPLYPYRALGQDEDASRPLVKCRLTTSKKKGGGGTREDDASVVAPNPSARSAVRRALGAKRNEKKKQGAAHLSKQRSTLSDMRSSMQSCSKAMSCMSLSSPWPMLSHSSRVSGSTSAICEHNRDQLGVTN